MTHPRLETAPATATTGARRPLEALAYRQLRQLLCALCAVLAACGGGGGGTPPPSGPVILGFTADRPGYFVGDTARLVATFQGGSGWIEPGRIAVTSGQAISTSTLSESTVYRLVVDDGSATATRDLALDVRYRDRLRTIAMPFARAEHAAVRLDDGRVLIIGGEDGGRALPDEVYQFDPATETFGILGRLSSGRVGMIAVAVGGGEVLVGLGMQSLTQAPAAEIIDGRTGATRPTVGAPGHSRMHATATLLADGRVLIAGGFGAAGADATAEIFDPATGRFTPLPAAMAKGRYGHTATRLDNGRVLLYGGYTNDLRPAPPELFDPATSAFRPLAAPESAMRANHVAVKARDGAVWILGGDGDSGLPIGTALRFDPETGFSTGATLAVPRTTAGGASLTDGRVILCGGASGPAAHEVEATSELLGRPGNPAGGPAMSTPRARHTATSLSTGKVLIVGGVDGGAAPLPTAEILE